MNTTLTDNSMMEARSPQSGQQNSTYKARSHELHGSGPEDRSPIRIVTSSYPDFDARSDEGTKRSRIIPEDNSSLDSKSLVDQKPRSPYCPKVNKLFE